uniref:Uncharacterized protein n=1 Tax=Micrurus spixii TaxID=129469 RepID=A0A2D4MBH6_9SAUR
MVWGNDNRLQDKSIMTKCKFSLFFSSVEVKTSTEEKKSYKHIEVCFQYIEGQEWETFETFRASHSAVCTWLFMQTQFTYCSYLYMIALHATPGKNTIQTRDVQVQLAWKNSKQLTFTN